MSAEPILNKISKTVEKYSPKLINNKKDLLSRASLENPKSCGFAIEKQLRKLKNYLPKMLVDNFNVAESRKASEDFSFDTVDNYHYYVDVKSHNLDTKFNMPNLTSVRKLTELYKDEDNRFCIIMNRYKIIKSKIRVLETIFTPIEHLDWSCLSIGALGLGQLQLTNANNIVIDSKQSRKKWIRKLLMSCEMHYDKQIKKNIKRVKDMKKAIKLL